METKREYPRSLSPIRGPLARELVERSVSSLGPQAQASRALLEAGIVPPHALTPLTLFLIASQPRPGRSREGGAPGPIAGGVWTREQITYHRPVQLDEVLETRGEIARRYVRAGRLFSVSSSETRNEAGKLVVSSCTTGLVQYRRDASLSDSEEGRSDADVSRPSADVSVAGANPSLTTLLALRVGDRVAGPAVEVSLARMRERDGSRDDNPIHTDPEAARRAGLSAPIAGGAHVLAYLQELLMRSWGSEVLLHGAHFDVRWISPVHAGRKVEPSASVSARDPDRVALQVEVLCEGRSATIGTLAIPLAEASGQTG
jgi:acyl dehydratase